MTSVPIPSFRNQEQLLELQGLTWSDANYALPTQLCGQCGVEICTYDLDFSCFSLWNYKRGGLSLEVCIYRCKQYVVCQKR